MHLCIDLCKFCQNQLVPVHFALQSALPQLTFSPQLKPHFSPATRRNLPQDAARSGVPWGSQWQDPQGGGKIKAAHYHPQKIIQIRKVRSQSHLQYCDRKFPTVSAETTLNWGTGASCFLQMSTVWACASWDDCFSEKIRDCTEMGQIQI